MINYLDGIPLEKSYLNCDICNKQLEHWIKNTQVVWCKRCNGKYCLQCWVPHRMKEEREEAR
jgi:hypothetical protein